MFNPSSVSSVNVTTGEMYVQQCQSHHSCLYREHLSFHFRCSV